VHIAPLEDFVMGQNDQFDHVACVNGTQYLTPVFFNAVLARMFMLARRSVTLNVDNQPQEHLSIVNTRAGEAASIFNNTPTMARFEVPQGWKKVLDQEQLLFRSRTSGCDVRGRYYRFERIEKGGVGANGNGVNGYANGHANGAEEGVDDFL
jgi:hypothetical protein